MQKEGKTQGPESRTSQEVSEAKSECRERKEVEREGMARLWGPLQAMERTSDSLANMGEANAGS